MLSLTSQMIIKSGIFASLGPKEREDQGECSSCFKLFQIAKIMVSVEYKADLLSWSLFTWEHCILIYSFDKISKTLKKKNKKKTRDYIWLQGPQHLFARLWPRALFTTWRGWKICFSEVTLLLQIEWQLCCACVRLFATPWTAAPQVPLSMGFSRQE